MCQKTCKCRQHRPYNVGKRGKNVTRWQHEPPLIMLTDGQLSFHPYHVSNDHHSTFTFKLNINLKSNQFVFDVFLRRRILTWATAIQPLTILLDVERYWICYKKAKIWFLWSQATKGICCPKLMPTRDVNHALCKGYSKISSLLKTSDFPHFLCTQTMNESWSRSRKLPKLYWILLKIAVRLFFIELVSCTLYQHVLVSLERQLDRHSI